MSHRLPIASRFLRIPPAAIALAGALALPSCNSTGNGLDTLDDSGDDLAGMVAPAHRPELPPADSSAVAASIVFPGSSWRIPVAARSDLDAVANRLKAGNGRVILSGCADAGVEEYSRMLGQQRAGEVAAALVERGIDADRIVTLSRGPDAGGRRPDRVDMAIVGQ